MFRSVCFTHRLASQRRLGGQGKRECDKRDHLLDSNRSAYPAPPTGRPRRHLRGHAPSKPTFPRSRHSNIAGPLISVPTGALHRSVSPAGANDVGRAPRLSRHLTSFICCYQARRGHPAVQALAGVVSPAGHSRRQTFLVCLGQILAHLIYHSRPAVPNQLICYLTD